MVKKISSAFIDRVSVRFPNLDGFFKISEESDRDYEYAVAWIDCFAKGSRLGRGIYYLGNHAPAHQGDEKPLGLPERKPVLVPCDLPAICLNTATMRLFNELYYRRIGAERSREKVHAFSFFYPLDNLGQWNRLYGKRGFYQYQCVIPRGQDREAFVEILEGISRAGEGSFLGVLKVFGKKKSPGMLSFPREGTTLALDFQNKSEKTLRLFKRLDEIVRKNNGAIYPAKDACMSPDLFFRAYPEWENFSQFIDPNCSSGFWRRISKEKRAAK